MQKPLGTSSSLALVLALFAGCGGGGGSSAPRTSPDPNAATGGVVVVLDTSAGGEEYVQFQVGAVTLERDGGAQTGNLLDEARVLTVCDPSGEAAGLRLPRVPAGDFRALHLLLVPGTGIVLDAAGEVEAVGGPVDVRVPIDAGLVHDPAQTSWLVVGHDAAPLAGAGGGGAAWTWTPTMRARADGEPMSLGGLAYPVVDGDGLRATAVGLGDAVVEIERLPGCQFVDADGNVYQDWQDFVGGLIPEDELVTRGILDRNGRIRCDRVFKTARGNQSRLIGRVRSTNAAEESFVMTVRAVNRRSSGLELRAPEDIVVLAAQAVIERPNGSPLAFGALAEGRLAKVTWTERLVDPNGIDSYLASLVHVPQGGGAPPQPQWRGDVQSVDLVEGVVVLTPRSPHGFVVGGELVQELEVRVDASTELVRQQPGGWTTIPLSEVQAGVDRAFVRGVVEGPAALRAARLRVRAN